MSQITSYVKLSGPGSGTVTSVTGGVGINITGNPSVNPTVNLTIPVTIAHGGTNATSFTTTDGTVYYDGTRLVTTTTGTSGQILTSQGAGLPPIFQSNTGGVITLNADTGSATGDPITIAGGSNISTSGALTTITVNVSGTTNHSVQVGNAGGSLTSITNGTTGQVLTAVTGANPGWTTLPTPIQTITGNSGGSISPSAGNINIVTANSTPTFIGSGSTETLDFNLTNLVLGSSLPALTSAVSCVGIGSAALSAVTSGSFNTAAGFRALENVSSGSENTALGYECLTSLLTGVNNIAVGGSSGSAYVGAESNNISINNSGIAAESNTIRIGVQGSGAGQQNRCFIAGIDGVNVGSTATVVTEVGTQLGTAVITAGTNISVTLGANSITISASTGSLVTNYTGIVFGSSPYTALSTDYYISADVTGGAITVRLPTSPTTGRTFVVKDKVGLAGTSNITVTTVSGAVNIDGATTFVMNTAYESANFIFNGSTYEVF
jgi:hypothetical protein